MRAEALGAHMLTVESCDNREKDMRDWLQARSTRRTRTLRRLQEKIVKAMEAYRKRYPLETRRSTRASRPRANTEKMLIARADDLPRFEARFKELLNENTIREMANFQSQLARERQTIRERIDGHQPARCTPSTTTPGATSSWNRRARRRTRRSAISSSDLRACTEGALAGSDEDARTRRPSSCRSSASSSASAGARGPTEPDRRWTRKVTDVRNWFTFSAVRALARGRARARALPDSGGKSGGQKEKLAYTVLAASLAYQFGLEWGVTRSRSFRFVVIDEAFGRGSDESARYGLELFAKLNLQLLIVTPLQKIHIIEPFVAGVGFVHNEEGRISMLRNLTIEEYRDERAAQRIVEPRQWTTPDDSAPRSGAVGRGRSCWPRASGRALFPLAFASSRAGRARVVGAFRRGPRLGSAHWRPTARRAWARDMTSRGPRSTTGCLA